jgi:trimeric autotransporter adhesin
VRCPQPTTMKKPLSLRLFVAGLCGLAPQSFRHRLQRHSRQMKSRHSERSEESLYFARCGAKFKSVAIHLLVLFLLPIIFLHSLHAQSIPLTGPQQLVFTGLLGSSNPSQPYAQFNAVQSDSSGNLYLLLDQKDGVRLLKTDPTATNILAQAQLGAAGDIGLALALDPSGNIYITGTTTSGTLQSTSGAAFPSPADTSTNSFIGKFDQNLNEIFLTFAGGSRIAASAIAATPDAVFLTGSIFAATLPVTPSAMIQSPASGSVQNGFVERFNATGTTLVYATYLSGQSLSGPANTAPTAIAADATDNAYITGYTTSTGYPTIAALVPALIPATVSTPAGDTTSGFLTKLTPAGDGILFSTFIPGPGLTSIAIDPAANNLLLSGSVALGQFPVATVSTPLVNTTYQTFLRLPLDGSTVLNSTLLAPGTQSTLTPTATATGATWIAVPSTLPATLLPMTPLSDIGNSYALRVTQQNAAQPVIDQTIRFGGLPTTNPFFASAPVTLTSLTTDPTGQPIFAGSVSPTASASLLATETYDLPLNNTPTAALPSTIRAAALPPGTCNGSLCAGSAAYIAKLNPAAAPSLALSTDNSPNLTLRNLGSASATNLQLTATNFTLATDCPSTLAPGAECSLALTSTATTPGTLTAQADNATPQTVTLPVTLTPPNPIVFSPKELDFGIETATSPAATRTITVTNLTQQSQSFTSATAGNQLTAYTFAETFSDCPAPGPITTKTLAPGATCHITLALTAAPQPANDGFAQSNWTIATGAVLLTGYTQAAPLSLSASEIDFGTQYTNGPRLPRYLYISNNSTAPISHTPVTLAAPFTLTDNCPTTLEPHTICQLQINYQSLQSPSADSTTLNLDEGLSVLITGTTLPPPTGTGQTVNPALTLTPTSITFPNAVVVTATSTTTETVTIGNTGAQPFSLTLGLTGDFTDTTNCPATLPGNASCTVLITFAPSQPGTRQGLLSVTAGSNASPAFVSLTGTGTALITGNNTLTFGNVIVGQPAVQWYKITQSFTSLTASSSNPQYTAILVEDIGYGHGQPPSTAFAGTYTGTCVNCWLGVQFTPSATGSQTATLTLTSGSSGTPAPFSLTGTGIPSTGLLLTPTTQDFGPIPVNSTSAPTLFTLTNQTTAAITLTAPPITGDFTLSPAPTGGPACTGTLAPGSSCFLQITFSPTATGQRSGLITLQTTGLNAAAAPLTGFGSPDPGLALNPTALIFNNVPGPTSTQQTITLTNTGSATLQIAAPTTATQNFAPTTTCTTLAPAATCTITVTFTPTTADVTDTLQIPVTSSTAGLTTYTVPLTGAYTTEDAGLQILPNQAQFGPTPTSTLGLTQQFTINNLTAKSLTLALSLPRQFILSNPPCAALAPNASCTFSVTFLPLTNGDITGTLFAQGTPTDGSATLNGLGYVEGYGIGSGSLVITGNLIPNDPVLNFGQVTSGQTSTQTLTLINPGPGPVTIRRITSQWPFLVTATTCGATLSPNQSCTATLTYTPLNQVATGTTLPRTNTDTGTLVVESDSLTSPDAIDLTGTAAPLLLNSPSNVAPLVSYTASQNSLTFPSTAIGDQSQAQTVVLANTGTTTVQITSIQTSPDFTVQSDPATCTAILPGASCLLTITFNPQSTKPESNGAPAPPTRISAIEITSTASSALDFISLLGTAAPAALTLSPLELNFGTVQVGGTSALPIQVTNTSANPAVFQGVFASGDYAVTGDCPTPGNTLAPATSCTLQVTFIPTQPGTRTGALSIATSLSTLPIAAPLIGIGIQSHLQITPSNLNFGSIALGASANQTLTLTNTGTAPLTALTLAITGDYAITVPCTATTLAPGASCAVTVTFSPTTLGARPGTLTVTSSDATSPDLVPLTGTGVTNGAFTLTVNGGPSASVTVQSEFPATYTLQLTPQANFTGNVVLNCVPITPGPYATCSLLPSSIALNGTPQTAIATINTITSINPTTAENRPGPRNRFFGGGKLRGSNSRGPYDMNDQRNAQATRSSDEALLCLLPTALFFFWRIRKTRTNTSKAIHPILWTVLFATTTLWLSGCGSGGDANLRRTPPGTYQYQVTASSTTGQVITQTVTLNLTVTPQ